MSAAALVAEALDFAAPQEREIAYSAVLPFARPGLMRLLCLGVRAYGFPSVKLKVGHKEAEEDKRRLEAVRAWLGRDVELRADANGAFSPDEALEVMEACHRARLTCLEQPVSPEDWGDLARRLPQPPPVALMADESVCTEEDLRQLHSTGALQALNCRVAKMGGLIPASRIGRAAAEEGLDILVGCHVGESSLLSAAGRHLAALMPEARWFEGSFDRWLLGASLAERPLSFGRGGRAKIRLTPGLGVELMPAALERVSLRKLTLWSPKEGGI
jgi:muconate cycloisomerase